MKLSIDKLLKTSPTIWGPSISNELGCLTDGIRNIMGNQVMEFIKKCEVPTNKN